MRPRWPERATGAASLNEPGTETCPCFTGPPPGIRSARRMSRRPPRPRTTRFSAAGCLSQSVKRRNAPVPVMGNRARGCSGWGITKLCSGYPTRR